jgi:hypothetical protein
VTSPTARLGYLQRQMLRSLTRCGGRYYVPPDLPNIKIAKSLERRGLISLTDCGMCTAAGRTVYIAEAINNEQ